MEKIYTIEDAKEILKETIQIIHNDNYEKCFQVYQHSWSSDHIEELLIEDIKANNPKAHNIKCRGEWRFEWNTIDHWERLQEAQRLVCKENNDWEIRYHAGSWCIHIFNVECMDTLVGFYNANMPEYFNINGDGTTIQITCGGK